MGLPGLIFLTALIVLAFGVAWRFIRWRRGRPSKMPILRGLLSMPRRYLADVHEVVDREPGIARMHVAAAGGFVALCVSIILVHGFGLTHWLLTVLLLAAALLMACGGGLVWYRRHNSDRSNRLSKGVYELLPYALLAFSIFYFVATLPLLEVVSNIDWVSGPGILLAILGIFGTGFIIPGMVLGPMRHALAGALHLAWHPRPDRFSGGKNSTDLQVIDLKASKLGVETPDNFSWLQLLSFDACVQCGRCEQVCPAFAAGAPLNPKKMIFDLWAASSGPGTDQSYAGNRPPGRAAKTATGTHDDPIIGPPGIIDAATLWSCTTCRACVEECPMMIEHVDAIIDLRRFETLEKGATPGAAPRILETLAQTDTVSGKALSTRLDWAADLGMPLVSEEKTIDVLLWLGEGAFEFRGQRTLRALVKIMQVAGTDFAVLGSEERDVGDTGRRLGDEATFQRLARANIETLQRYTFRRIVTCDPHVLHCIRNEYPALGGRFEVIHHTTFVDSLIESDAIGLDKGDANAVTYHDPCYLGRYNGEFDAPRRLLNSIGIDTIEMPRSRERSFCCGWGGGATVTDIPSEKRIPDLRMAQANKTGAATIAVACPNCAFMFEGVPGNQMQVSDVVELVALAVQPAALEEVDS